MVGCQFVMNIRKTMDLQTRPGEFVDVDGMQVEADALRVAEAIKEYDPNLEILCVDPARAEGLSEAPFVIAEHCKDGVLRPVFQCWALDNTVLERIKLADGKNFDLNTTIEQAKLALAKDRNRRYEDVREEAKDVVAHIAGMKSRYTVRDSRTGELVTYYDDRPSTRK
jgi:hypothetical protein